MLLQLKAYVIIMKDANVYIQEGVVELMKIDETTVEKVAMLARLELDEDKKEEMTEQLNDILEYADKLNELDTEDVEPTAHALPIKNVFREDKVEESLDREAALKNAPEREDGSFKVPQIIDNDE